MLCQPCLHLDCTWCWQQCNRPRSAPEVWGTQCVFHTCTYTYKLTFMGPCTVIIILIYIQRDAILHSLFYLETALHVSGGTSTHLQDPKQPYLQHLVFVTPLLLQHTQTSSNSSTISGDNSNGVKNTRCCRYSCLRC